METMDDPVREPGEVFDRDMRHELVERIERFRDPAYRAGSESFVGLSRREWLFLFGLYVVFPAVCALIVYL